MRVGGNKLLTFRKCASQRRKKRWSGVFAKSQRVGERSRGFVPIMCDTIETKKDSKVDVWLAVRPCCSVDSVYVCACVLISQSECVMSIYA